MTTNSSSASAVALLRHWPSVRINLDAMHTYKIRISSFYFNYSSLFVMGCVYGYFWSTESQNSSALDQYPEAESILEKSLKKSANVSCKETTSEIGEELQSRILCIVMTSPKEISKAKMVKETWGRRCDKLLFMNSENDTPLPTIGFSVDDSSDLQWQKVKLSLRHIYTNYLNEYDWFLKTDHNTYTVVENLRTFVSPYNSSMPFFFGREFQFQGDPYFSGAAGYLFSRETLRRVIELGFDGHKCQTTEGDIYEDVNMGKCVKEIGGIFGDSRDSTGIHRFIPFHITEFYSGKSNSIEFMQIDFDMEHKCCSSKAITLRCRSAFEMQVYEYLVYKMKIANIQDEPHDQD